MLGLLIKIFPGFWKKFSTSVLASAEIKKLPWDSDANHLIEEIHGSENALKEHQKQEDAYHVRFEETLAEIQKDIIKNTLMTLMRSPADESERVRYELAKLEHLDADCWIVDVATSYLKEHMN